MRRARTVRDFTPTPRTETDRAGSRLADDGSATLVVMMQAFFEGRSARVTRTVSVRPLTVRRNAVRIVTARGHFAPRRVTDTANRLNTREPALT